jgi:pentose-5-phosphate-3-epimerase
VKRIQIDVCDGEYVVSLSWPFTEYQKNEFAKLGEKADFDVYLPDWEKMNYSVDLMVKSPEKYIQTFVAYGVDEVVVHFRSVTSGDTWNKIFEQSKTFDLNLVVAVDMQTDVDEFLKFAQGNIENINAFQVMGIEKIGFQGQEFAEKSLEIVKALKKKFKTKKIYFDGGINAETIEEIHKSGVDVFCVGSFLTQSDDFSSDLKYLKELLG